MTNTTSVQPRTAPMQPLRAARALARLIAEPSDTQQVFTIIEALSGDTSARLVARMRTVAGGRRLLDTRADLLGRLSDRTAMEALPAGSLGRAYLDFIDSEGISADGLVAASHDGESVAWAERSDDVGYLKTRLRDTHDLWHVLTGFGGDIFGEASLLAFTCAQTGNPGVGVMAIAANLRAKNRELARTAVRAFRAGRRAAWLPAVVFEDLLALPLDEVRALLGIIPAAPYTRWPAGWTRAPAA